MGAFAEAQPAGLVGRDVERARLCRMLEEAAGGKPGVLLVSGEAGVGKTVLVRDACQRFGGQVLWGACVHLSASPVPFAAVVSALDGWLREAGGHARDEVLDGLDAVRPLLPSESSAAAAEPGLLLTQLDAAVLRIARRHPVVLVVDDLQWADPSTLDLLSFLVAGLGTQTLAVLATVRDEDHPDGHRVNRWLAEIRRMPQVSEFHLDRLGPEDTADLVEALVGQEAAAGGLAARVFDRSGGNPYLTELLVFEPASGPSAAPVSEALRAALLLRWYGLSETGREVTRLVALGGRPVDVEVLERVAGLLGAGFLGGGDVRAGVRESVTAGVLARPQGGSVWFRHPLIAEVLTGDATSPDPSPAHSAYAKVLATRAGSAPGDVARHYDLAGEWSEALRWSLAAAASAAAVQGAAEHLGHLQRACRLWPRVRANPDSVDEHVDLLLRTSRAAQCVAQPQQALKLIEEALTLTGPANRPEMTCRLLTLRHRMLVEANHLPWTEVTAPLREAEKIAASLPGSPVQAMVNAQLSWTQSWAGHEQARMLADAALATARATGAPDALIPALVVSALTRPEAPEAMSWLEEAYELARVSGDVIEMLDAALGMHNLHQAHGQYAAALDEGLRRGTDLFMAGAPVAARFVLTSAAYFALCLGRWSEAEASLRPALAAADGGHRESVARATMALLCVRRGDLSRAQRELARAEQVSSTEYMGTATYPFAQVELHIASRRPAEALAVVEAQIGAAVLGDPRDGDEFLLLGARAAADLAQDARDHGRADATAVGEAALAQVLSAGSRSQLQSFAPWDETDLVQPARRALFEAELGRLRDSPDQGDLWAAARDACRLAGLRWEEGLAAEYQARATLSAGRSRDESAQALREAMVVALELGAAPLRRSVETTARAGHIPLDPVREAPTTAQAERAPATLTAREQEVLAHVVAGRSNSEIAKALFISDKTVSVHISNILRKSGTTSRVEAAAWANRLADAP